MILPHSILNPDDVNKPWMILINGLFANKSSWTYCAEHLTGHFRVLTYDGKGQGSGPRPNEAYRFEGLISDLLGLVDSLGIQKTHLLGISQGGRIALKFAEKFPARCLGVIAANSYDQMSPLLRLKINSWQVAQKSGGALVRFDVAAPWIWSEALLNEKPELYSFYRERAGLENPKVIERLIESSLEGSVDVSRIQAPVLYVSGEEDCLTPLSLQKKMRASTRISDLVEVRGGHASLLEFPESLSQKVIPAYLSLLQIKWNTPQATI